MTNFKHGLTGSIYYNRWNHMMDRCYDTENPAYPDYGGRGIKVCEAWHDISVYASQLPDGFFEGAHLDRIDNNGDYEPGNMRWSTPRQNHSNRRSRRELTYLGVSLSVSEWSRMVNIHRAVITNRIDEWGWSVEKALTTPTISTDERMAIARQARWGNHQKKPDPPKLVLRTVEYQGATVTLVDLVKMTGIPYKKLSKRIFERGWDVDRAVAKG